MRKPTPTTIKRFPTCRVAQLEQMARNQGKTVTGLFTELVRKEWARTEKVKIAPLGFFAELPEFDDRTIIVGGDHIGKVPLTVAEAREFCRGAALVLAGKRPVVAVVASHASMPAMIRLNRQGLGYTLAIVCGDGDDQTRRSQGLGSTMVKDLISAIIDRALAVPVAA